MESLNGLRGICGRRSFSGRGEYDSCRDIDHEREYEDFHGFVGHSDLFDDVSLIIACLC